MVEILDWIVLFGGGKEERREGRERWRERFAKGGIDESSFDTDSL